MARKAKKLSLRDLPDELYRRMNFGASDSTVVMYAYHTSDTPLRDNDQHFVYGIGTLVSINGIDGILTAEHVWKNFADRDLFRGVVFEVGSDGTHVNLDKDVIQVHTINGIDICFLRFPPGVSGVVRAKRTIITIQKERLPVMAKIKMLNWLLIGFPRDHQPKEKGESRVLWYYTHLTRYDGETDEIELQVNYDDDVSPLPATFVGFSGGGIWNYHLTFNDNDEFEIKKKTLVGVCVKQSQILERDKRYITGIGPQTIYSLLPGIVKP